MTARRSRIRLFAGCALFALAIGAAISPSLALAQQAGRLPAPVRQAVAETTSVAPTGPTATQQAPHVALPPVAQKFFAAVRANFAQWDLNHDGRLTREEIELDMQDARITGEAAAALAALKIGATKFDKLDETRDFGVAARCTTATSSTPTSSATSTSGSRSWRRRRASCSRRGSRT
jgi:hypothetical protein